jgi:hypothetical protein
MGFSCKGATAWRQRLIGASVAPIAVQRQRTVIDRGFGGLSGFMRMNNKNFPRKSAASAKSAVYHGSQYPAKLLQNAICLFAYSSENEYHTGVALLDVSPTGVV